MAEDFEGADDSPPIQARGIRRLTWLAMIVGLVVVGVAVLSVTQSAKDAMQAAPNASIPVDQVYVQRCGSCHPAPAAKDYASWKNRWEDMANLTLFMGDERQRVLSYLEGLGNTKQ